MTFVSGPNDAPGRFITFEGGEGSGKTTQIKLLCDFLEENGVAVAKTREPGGTPGAEAIRDLLVRGDAGRWDAESEGLLHFAARRDHVERMIRPALASGVWVVSDRFADSTMAYQGYAHGLGRDWVSNLHELVLGDFAPDLTLVLDIPVDAGLDRANVRGGEENRYELLGPAFHQSVRDGFLDIARREPGRCVVIAATETRDMVAQAIRDTVAERLGLPTTAIV